MLTSSLGCIEIGKNEDKKQGKTPSHKTFNTKHLHI